MASTEAVSHAGCLTAGVVQVRLWKPNNDAKGMYIRGRDWGRVRGKIRFKGDGGSRRGAKINMWLRKKPVFLYISSSLCSNHSFLARAGSWVVVLSGKY